jgi:hypothetical protein
VDIPDIEAITSEYPSAINVDESRDSETTDLFISNDTDDVDIAEIDGAELDFTGLENRNYYIIVAQPTKLKNTTTDSSELTSTDFFALEKGQSLDITSWSYSSEDNHLEIKLASDATRTYYAYAPHVEVYNLQNQKIETLPVATNQQFLSGKKKTKIKLPGFVSDFYLEDPIIPKGHFTWAEATKNGTRLPESKSVVINIQKIAKELEGVRKQFGDRPIVITSWYRPPAVNALVGGSSRSRHMVGDAVDFAVVGLSIWDVQAEMEKSWKKGGLGMGANAGGFVHIDLGGVRKWYYP